ncbi:hypothetical protein [Halomarina rubra]|uniref:Uncharacterized protein n=1 Tax=Halomarina rubra TaxID=2071873 RepID=A0ABD6B1D4_9EURY|nr:hypothetical protein [Halomarina rubra]
MGEYKATFEIESKTDAHAVERVLTRLYDSLREEARTVGEGTTDSTEMLEQFATVRDAAQEPMPGTLTVIFEQDDDPFEE